MNLYAYCGNNPLNCVDPSGLFSLPSIPIECIVPKGVTTSMFAQHARDEVENWLMYAGFYETYTRENWILGEVWVEGDYVNITIDYIGDACDVCEPSFSVKNFMVTHTSGPLKGDIADYVPLVFFDGIALLTQRALDRIIEPAIHEINGWNNWLHYVNMGANLLMYERLLNEWDSEELKYTSIKFRYYGQIYSGSDINYIVGGHAFRHYNMNKDVAAEYVHIWKNIRGILGGRGSRSYEDLTDTYFWFWEGYYGYNSRKNW